MYNQLLLLPLELQHPEVQDDTLGSFAPATPAALTMLELVPSLTRGDLVLASSPRCPPLLLH